MVRMLCLMPVDPAVHAAPAAPAELVMQVFGAVGEVAMVRIRKPGQAEPLLTKGLRNEVGGHFP